MYHDLNLIIVTIVMGNETNSLSISSHIRKSTVDGWKHIWGIILSGRVSLKNQIKSVKS